jgi:hypothetical protein
MAMLMHQAKLHEVGVREAVKNAGFMLPEVVRKLLIQQAEFLTDMAASVERLESLIDIGEDVEPESDDPRENGCVDDQGRP